MTRPAAYDLTALYHEHRLSLVRMAALFVDDLASAEDVVHDAFVAMYRNGHRLRDEKAALAYLRTCVMNAARSVLRRRQTARKYRHRFIDTDVAPADTEVLLSEEHQAVLAALRRLPDRQREVLTLRYWSVGAIGVEPRANTYARVGSAGGLTPIALPAVLTQAGWQIEATTATGLLLSHGDGSDANPGPITELAWWNPLTGAITVIEQFTGGPALDSFLAWNSYYSGS